MARKIKNINIQLNQIAIDMRRFQFQTTSIASSGGYEQEQRNRLTTSFFGDVSKFVGRKEDKSKIVRMLTTMSISSSTSLQSSSVNSDIHEKVSVISIVGMGGVGKTSLAQSIYNDKYVENQFAVKMWVCISDDFDVLKILKNIMESAINSKCEDFSNPEVLVKKIPWNGKNLKSVLDCGSAGSKVIVTTRSQKVASVVEGSIPPYNLNVLSEAECWSIIEKKAFYPGGASATPNMKTIGKEIAKKCGGLPLAAKNFGGLMHSQRYERDWLSIRANKSLKTQENPCGGIIPILKLSYDSLPSHLKQYFSYCCLFPKDWDFGRERLIQLWIAEGFFIHHLVEEIETRSKILAMITSLVCYVALSFKNQDVERDVFIGDIETVKMHDLVHDLALGVVGSHEVMILNTSEMENDLCRIRRLRFIMEGIPETHFDALRNATKLRTIIFQEDGFVFPSPPSNKRLRVIRWLYGAHNNLKFLTSSFKFRHMRFLDLRYSNLEYVHAESIHQLYNIQTLNLSFSKNAQNILKEGIGCLINLRHLDLFNSDINLLPDSILMLTNLQTLNIRRCKGISVLPKNIGHLQNLTMLNFMSCDQLKSLPRNFGALTRLRSLNLYDTSITELLESLTSNICKLEYVNFGEKCKFPKDIKNWVELRILECEETDNIVMPSGIKTLTRLEKLYSFMVSKKDNFSMDTFRYNSTSSSIHQLGDLNSLRKLYIVNLENVRGGKLEAETAKLKYKRNIHELLLRWSFKEEGVVVNDSDTVLEGVQPHPNLEGLDILDYPGLKLPKWMGSSFCLPNLVRLKFYYCKNCEILVGLGQLPCLQILQIEGMNSVKCLGVEFYYQQEEEEEEEVKCLDLRLWTSALKILAIESCQKLKSEHVAFYLDKFLPSIEYYLK
ncbi:disease resistance protein RGA2-like [Papaver somniferum]|uniref:disease resistance protein RGA2-like n=1 Tax=Papaver somniferum TaxID=3469 RepID=UPI000E705E54|nr:disease resistance protein RGA2-like [Papaver somniferum]